MKSADVYIPKPRLTHIGFATLPVAALAVSRAARIAIHAHAGQRAVWHAAVGDVYRDQPVTSGGLWLAEITDANGICVWEWACLRATAHVRTLRLGAGERVAFLAHVNRQLDGTYALYRPTQLRRQE